MTARSSQPRVRLIRKYTLPIAGPYVVYERPDGIRAEVRIRDSGGRQLMTTAEAKSQATVQLYPDPAPALSRKLYDRRR
jgi:hypothetical protein